MENNNTPITPGKPSCGCRCGQQAPSVTAPSCGNENPTPCMNRVGYAFVPAQTFNDIYSPEEALCRGTLYPELHMPFGMYGAEVG